MNITKRIISHYKEGRDGYKPVGICIHIADGTLKEIDSTFQSEEKSAHYVVGNEGEIIQYVAEENTAWTQGVVKNPTAEIIKVRSGINPNLFLLSIENEGYGDKDIPEIQYQTNAEIVRYLCDKWKIPLERKYILRHNEIRKDKICPGKIDVDKIVELALKLNKEEEVRTEILKKKVSILEKLVALWIKLKSLIA